jgi:hypothetical protein
LGFKDYIDFYEYLKTLNSQRRLKENRALKTNSRKQENERKNIESWTQQIREYEKRLKDIDTNGNVKQNQKMIEMIEEIKERQSKNFEEIPMQQLKGYFKDYSKLSSHYDSLRSELLDEKTLQFLQLGLELIDKEDNCPFCRKSKSNINEIKKDASARLSGAQKYLEVNKALSKAYEELLSSLESFVAGFNGNKLLIEDDLSKLSKISGMENLTKTENRIISHPYFNEIQEVLEEIKELENLSSYDEFARSKLLNFINKKSDFFFNNKLVIDIMEFKHERNRVISQVLSELEKKFGGASVRDSKESINLETRRLTEKIKEAENNIKELEIEAGPLKKDVDTVNLIKTYGA